VRWSPRLDRHGEDDMWTCSRCKREFLSSSTPSVIRCYLDTDSLSFDRRVICKDCHEDFLSFMKHPEGDSGHE